MRLFYHFVSLLCKTKICFFGKLDYRVVSDNRIVGQLLSIVELTIVGPLFLEKAFHKESIILNNNNKIISNNEKLAEIFNKHFSKLLENLDIDNV